MAVITSTQNPFSFTPSGNTTVRPIFTRITVTPTPVPSPTPVPTATGTTTARKIRCCGRPTGNICIDVDGTACPRGTSECDVAGDSCAPPPTPTITTTVSSPTPTCEYVEEEAPCSSLNGFSEYRGIASRKTLRLDADGRAIPLGCQADLTINTDWNTSTCEAPPSSCTPPSGPFEQTINVPCIQVDPQLYNTGVALQTQTRTYIVASANTSEICPYTEWVNTQLNTSQCAFVETTCTPPTGPFTRTVDVACTSVSSNFISGVAKQTQVRDFDASSPPGTVCRYTDWVNSGQPDTSLCQLPNLPVTCTTPTGPFNRNISIPCSQIDSKYNGGTALQPQIRRYDASANVSGPCPYTEWENSGTPNLSACTQPIFWRNCITGQLVEGIAPSTYIQVSYAQGGTCWEPIVDLGFTPSLNEALRYSYQRGSARLPEAKVITVSNGSYGTSYTVKITTNPDVIFAINDKAAGKGTTAFTITPRSEVKLTVSVSQELLQQLQDGLSTLSMSVEYERIVV